MKRREIEKEINLALEYLPKHVRGYVEDRVAIHIGRIPDDDGSVKRQATHHGLFVLEECECCKQDRPGILIDCRIEPFRLIKRVFLHEVAHVWLTFRKLKSGEHRADMLAQLWLMNGQRHI